MPMLRLTLVRVRGVLARAMPSEVRVQGRLHAFKRRNPARERLRYAVCRAICLAFGRRISVRSRPKAGSALRTISSTLSPRLIPRISHPRRHSFLLVNHVAEAGAARSTVGGRRCVSLASHPRPSNPER
jgi:hypothetical protein